MNNWIDYQSKKNIWQKWNLWGKNSRLFFKRSTNYDSFYVLLKFQKLIMSKRYSGKSFKDSSVKKKPKLSFKEKRKLKKDKQKKTN